MLISSFIPQKQCEHFLCTKHSSECWGYRGGQDIHQSLPSWSSPPSRGTALRQLNTEINEMIPDGNKYPNGYLSGSRKLELLSFSFFISKVKTLLRFRLLMRMKWDDGCGIA